MNKSTEDINFNNTNSNSTETVENNSISGMATLVFGLAGTFGLIIIIAILFLAFRHKLRRINERNKLKRNKENIDKIEGFENVKTIKLEGSGIEGKVDSLEFYPKNPLESDKCDKEGQSQTELLGVNFKDKLNKFIFKKEFEEDKSYRKSSKFFIASKIENNPNGINNSQQINNFIDNSLNNSKTNLKIEQNIPLNSQFAIPKIKGPNCHSNIRANLITIDNLIQIKKKESMFENITDIKSNMNGAIQFNNENKLIYNTSAGNKFNNKDFIYMGETENILGPNVLKLHSQIVKPIKIQETKDFNDVQEFYGLNNN